MIRKAAPSIVLLALLAVPTLVAAHAGTEKTAGSVKLYANWYPISPLVGEEVKGVFVLWDETKQPLRNFRVTYSVYKTFVGEAGRDQLLSTEERATDVNGVVEFSRAFEEDAIYHLELRFTDPKTRRAEETGILIQARNPAADPKQEPRAGNDDRGRLIAAAAASLAAGVALGFLLRRK